MSCDYQEFGLSENPLDVFNQWFTLAQEKEKMAEAFCLSTSSALGIPSGRMLLYKGLYKQHFLFYSNYESMKGKEITENPWAVMVFYWPNIYRQVRIMGSVQKVPRSLSEEYFSSRPRNSQISAASSKQSSLLHNRQELIKRCEEVELKFLDQAIECPANWGGYMLSPIAMEFWIGQENRLHDRFHYKLVKNQVWDITRLAP